MIYRRLDANGDMIFGNGGSSFLSDADATAQAVVTRLKLFEGEWWADLNDGLPLFQAILGYAGSNKDAVDRLISSRILDTPHVSAMQSFSSSYDGDTRKYTFTATIDTDYGLIAISSEPFVVRDRRLIQDIETGYIVVDSDTGLPVIDSGD